MLRHFAFIAVYTLLATPWYWDLTPESWAMQRVFGLPLWVAVSVAGSFGVSLHTCLIFLRPWPVELEDDGKEKVEP